MLVIGWRAAFEWLAARVALRERLLLVGTGPAAVTLARELFERRLELGVDIVGFVDPDPARIGDPVINPGVIGAIDDIPSLVSKHDVDRVVVSLSDQRGKLPMDRLLNVRMQSGVLFDHLASVYEEYTGKIAVENLRPSWLVFSEGFTKRRGTLIAKRTIDIVLSVIGLVLSLPLLPVIALAILAVQGKGSSGLLIGSLVGVGFLAGAVVLFALVHRKISVAGAIGSALESVASFLRKLVRKPPVTDWAEAAVRFRGEAIRLISSRWIPLTMSTLVGHLGVYLVLVLAVRDVGISAREVT